MSNVLANRTLQDSCCQERELFQNGTKEINQKQNDGNHVRNHTQMMNTIIM